MSERIRLNSWKEIAQYVGRDLRTVARWEQEHGLPVHRIGEGKRRPVFAYTDEIDQWLAHANPNGKSAEATDVLPSQPQPRRFRGIRAGFILGLAGLALFTVARVRQNADLQLSEVRFSEGGLIAFDANHKAVWTSVLSHNPGVALAGPSPALADIDGDGTTEILACLRGNDPPGVTPPYGAELICLSNRGDVRWRLSADHTLRMGGRDYSGPWEAGTWAFANGSSGSFIALAVRHFTWWPSIIITADAKGRVLGNFVNSGWIHALAFIERPSKPLLLAGGISNSQDAAVFAVLDAERTTGSSPEESGSNYDCESCPAGKPLQYVVLPRSELNRTLSTQYNSVSQIQVFPDRILVRTFEVASNVAQTETDINAIYEFTPELQIKSVEYDHHYWDLHRRLENEGKLNHSQAECLERKGPRVIRSWTPEDGWKKIPVSATGN